MGCFLLWIFKNVHVLICSLLWARFMTFSLGLVYKNYHVYCFTWKVIYDADLWFENYFVDWLHEHVLLFSYIAFSSLYLWLMRKYNWWKIKHRRIWTLVVGDVELAGWELSVLAFHNMTECADPEVLDSLLVWCKIFFLFLFSLCCVIIVPIHIGLLTFLVLLDIKTPQLCRLSWSNYIPSSPWN